MTLAPWASPEDLPPGRPDLPEGGRAWEDYLQQASEILFALSGSVYGAQQAAALVEARRYGAARPFGWLPSWGVCLAPVGVLGDADPCACRSPREIDLPDTPVATVDRVRVGTVELPTTAYEILGARTLRRLDGGRWLTCRERIVVEYTYGSPPPEAGRGAALALAVELAKLEIDPPSSRLSRKAQQLTRQGVTISGFDPVALLEKGRLGVEAADLFLTTVLTRPRLGGWVWSPDLDPQTARLPLPSDP